MKAGNTSGFLDPAALRRCLGIFIGGLLLQLLLLMPTPRFVVGTFIIGSTEFYHMGSLLFSHSSSTR